MADKVRVQLQVPTREGGTREVVEVDEGRAAALVRGNAAVRVDDLEGGRQAETSQATRDDLRASLERQNLDDLRKTAADRNVEGRSDMNKAQLIDAILRSRATS